MVISCRRCGEWRRVKLFRCDKCLLAQYCSRACQREDWRIHKPSCSSNWDPSTSHALVEALIEASASAELEAIKYLVSTLGADPEHVLLAGPNVYVFPLGAAAQKGHPSSIRTLLDLGVACNQTAGPLRTSALYIASAEGQVAVIDLLISRGANVDHARSDGATAASVAAQEGNVEALSRLLIQGASANTSNREGVTPMYLAAQNGHASSLQSLIANGGAVDQATLHGETPLMAAVEAGHESIVGLLLSNGCNAQLKDDLGRTALDLAITHKYPSVEAILQAHINRQRASV